MLIHVSTCFPGILVVSGCSLNSWARSCMGVLSLWHAVGSQKTAFLNTSVLVAQSCPTLCDLIDCSPSGSSVHGILQARVLEWVAVLFSRRSSWPSAWTRFSWIAGRFFTIWVTRKASPGSLPQPASINPVSLNSHMKCSIGLQRKVDEFRVPNSHIGHKLSASLCLDLGKG